MVYQLPVQGYFRVNSYFLIDENTQHGFLIDPGAQGNEIARMIVNKGWTIEKILLTHGHFDHIGGVKALQQQLGLHAYIHANGNTYLSNPRLNLSAVCGEYVVVPEAEYFNDGATFSLQDHTTPILRAIHTPGHTPDSTTFYDWEDGIAFVGDTIFRGSIGSDQYPGGNRRQLMSSIRERIFTLPENTVLYSGHSEPTTVKMEKQRLGL
ncbi:MAG: MBL fold metallo-hydrolase [Clostridia bacterium]|nr:MBL fold metallo-hydrolase [Clostridia bacterium]